jgi:hypothetical protein
LDQEQEKLMTGPTIQSCTEAHKQYPITGQLVKNNSCVFEKWEFGTIGLNLG